MLSELLSQRFLRRAADTASFKRGKDYFLRGTVGAIREREDSVSAQVQGTHTYRVRLWPEHGEVEYSCTCPVGREGVFCKHCVALGLAWLDSSDPKRRSAKKSSRPSTTIDDVRRWLLDQDPDTLVELILSQADQDDRLHRRLLLEAARANDRGLDLDAYRQALDHAVDTDGFVDYQHAYDYAEGIEDVVDEFEALLGAGHAAEVLELAEYALEAVERALGYADDSDGDLGMILGRLEKLHLAACRKAKPDPEELATRLFEWGLQSDWETFYDAVEAYRHLLGKKGIAAYRRLAEEQWAKLRPLAPGDDDRERYGQRFRITGIMKRLARLSGDVDALVEVKKRDLSHAYDYYQIAEIYKQARKYNEALDWAERGVAAFPERTDTRLRELLATEYHRRKKHKEAMEVVWQNFVDWPGLEQYRNLKSHAQKSGGWDEWRPRALELLRPSEAETGRASRRRLTAWSMGRDGSDLVDVLLWDADVEAAWKAALEGGCSESRWLELADRRTRKHPEDALPIYQRSIPGMLNRKNNAAYREAVALLKKVQDAMARLDQRAEFAGYLESVRVEHRRKRNFMKLLDREDW